jgi:hypothetical protein
VETADKIAIDLNGLFGESFKIDKKSDLSKHIAAVREKIGKPFGDEWVDASSRRPVTEDVNKLQLWNTTIRGFIDTNPNFEADLLAAFKNQSLKTERSSLRSKLVTLGVSGNDLTKEYDQLLKRNGPWTPREKYIPDLKLFLTTHGNWQMGEPEAETLAKELVKVGGKPTDVKKLLEKFTKDTFGKLKVHYANIAELWKLVVRYPNEGHLKDLAEKYLPYKNVSGANFAILFNAGQIRLEKGSHKNPFRYWCASHSMGEAEAALDALWVHGLGQNVLLWGVVHVHYHGQATIMLDANNPNRNYYHVKPGNFAGSLGPTGAIADAAAKTGIDHAMNNLSLTGKSI